MQTSVTPASMCFCRSLIDELSIKFNAFLLVCSRDFALPWDVLNICFLKSIFLTNLIKIDIWYLSKKAKLNTCTNVLITIILFQILSADIHKQWQLLDFLFLCLFLCGFCHTREFFTYMKTSPLQMKDNKVWLMLGSQGHWEVRFL